MGFKTLEKKKGKKGWNILFNCGAQVDSVNPGFLKVGYISPQGGEWKF